MNRLMNTVKEVVQEDLEDTTLQDEMMAWLRANVDGKRITATHIKKMREALSDDTIRLDKRFNMTHLERGGWSASKGETGVSLLIAHCTTNVTIDCDRIVNDLSSADFSGATTRNESRTELLEDEQLVADLDAAITAYNEAKATLERLMKDPKVRQVATQIRMMLVDADGIRGATC